MKVFLAPSKQTTPSALLFVLTFKHVLFIGVRDSAAWSRLSVLPASVKYVQQQTVIVILHCEALETFFSNYWRTSVFLWSYWYPCFGILVMSALGFLRFTSGATPANPLTASMVAEPFDPRTCTCTSIDGTRTRGRICCTVCTLEIFPTYWKVQVWTPPPKIRTWHKYKMKTLKLKLPRNYDWWYVRRHFGPWFPGCVPCSHFREETPSQCYDPSINRRQ